MQTFPYTQPDGTKVWKTAKAIIETSAEGTRIRAIGDESSIKNYFDRWEKFASKDGLKTSIQDVNIFTTPDDPVGLKSPANWVPHEPASWPFRFMTLKQDQPPIDYVQFGEKKLMPGGRVKIVMCSRLGDVGLTQNLSADFGYGLRIDRVKLAEMFENFSNEP